MANPKGINSTKIPIGATLVAYIGGIAIFRGICEVKKTTIDTVGSHLNFTGREEMVLLTEDEISPSVWDYKNVSDNYIIEDICTPYGWKFSLDTEKKIVEYKIGSSSVRKAQVIQDVAKLNGFVLLKRGLTLIKTKLPTSLDYGGRVTGFEITNQENGFTNYNNRVLSSEITENITSAKSKIKGYTYWTGKAKPKIKSTIQNDTLLNGSYPSRIRNTLTGATGNSVLIDRTHHISVPVKDVKDLDEALSEARRELDMKISVSVTMVGYLDLDLLNTIEVFIEDEGIKQYMYIDEITLSYDSTNKFTTQLNLIPIIPFTLI
jgi:prophage tail gpP-like protein